MTARHDPDQLVHDFLLEGPEELPTRSIEVIRGHVHGTRQRANRPWTLPALPRSILLAAAVAAIVLAAAAMLLVGSGAPTTAPIPAASAPGGAVATPSPSVVPTVSPAASPTIAPYPLADGEAWIVFEGDDRIHLIRPDGTGLHPLLPDLSCGTCDPAWSPDGRQVVFSYNDGDGAQLWVVNADGTDARPVTSAIEGCPNGRCVEAIHPAWSPDGASIAYIAPQHDGGILVDYSLQRLDLATGVATELYATTDVALGRPTWSPDSSSIAFESVHFAGSPELSAIIDNAIAVLDLSAVDATPTVITEGTRLAGYPTWHPTDDVIVFRTNRLTSDLSAFIDPTVPSDLYTVRSDGSDLTRVTDEPVGETAVRAPSWTPDGRILYSRLANLTAGEELRIINADGTGDVSATGSVVTLGEGRWRPGT